MEPVGSLGAYFPNEYFVRDGHHRISVARAMGQAYIDAYVARIELA